MDAAEAIEVIERAFKQVPHPGDAFLLGSHDGGEPLEEVGAFHGLTDWHTPTPAFLDAHYPVLSFLSEAGFRYFCRGVSGRRRSAHCRTADPCFT